jgi:hypothetical protein
VIRVTVVKRERKETAELQAPPDPKESQDPQDLLDLRDPLELSRVI